MRIGILTGGGDCPGLNAAIRAAVRRALQYNNEVIGIKHGWAGLLKLITEPLTLDSVSGVLPKGGTILKTSRTNPLKSKESAETTINNFRKLELDALIAIGGEDTLGVAKELFKQGLPVVGIPKTIDNDLPGTDQTFGFDTAVNIAMEAIDRLHTTAESHDRVIVVEVMGRHTGWIAVAAGIAGGADVILIPERPFDIENVCQVITKRHERGRDFSIVVVAEGAKLKTAEGDELVITQSTEVDAFGHVRLGGIGNLIAQEIERRTGFETRAVILGHIQRGGTPTAFDRILATRFGVKAVDLVCEGKFGVMTALKGNQILPVPLEEALTGIKQVDPEMYELSSVFFG